MFRKLTVVAFFIASLMVILLSTGAMAAEKAEKGKEIQAKEIKGQMHEFEVALEREDNKEKAAKMKANLQEYRKKLERLMGRSRAPQKPKGEFAEIEMAIRRSKANLEELRHAIAGLREKGDQPDRLEELGKKLGQEERKLVEYTTLLKKRMVAARRKKAKPRSKLMILKVKYANAGKLADIIEKFLSPAGIIAADPDSNSLVIKDSPDGLETALMIIEALDVQRRRGPREQSQRRDQPQRRQGSRERAERENIFYGKVLEANKESLTIETRDSKEKVTLFVPSRRKEDGTQVLYEELSIHVSRFKAGSIVRVQWRQGDVKRFIERVTEIEGGAAR